MKRIFRYKFEILVGAGTIFLYFFVRIYHLTIIPVFVDEAIYIRWAQIMENEPALRFLPLSDGKQPLFMWAVIPFLKIFSDPLVAGRIVSVITGFGTLVGISLLTFYLFRNVRTALVAALLYAVSPFTVFFDRMALADSMLTMFGVWVLLLGIITARSLRLDFAMLSGFALGGALLTKSPAIFYSLFMPLSFIFTPTLKKLRPLKISFVSGIKFIGLLLVTYIIGYAIYNILRLGENFHLIGQRNLDYVLPLSHLWTRPLDPLIPYADRAKEWLWMMGPSGLVVLAILGLTLGLKRFPKETLVLTAWAIFPILVQSEFAKVITARYILFSLPPLIIIASITFAFKNKNIKLATLFVFLVFLIQSGLFDYYLLTNPGKANLPQSERSGYLEEWTAGTGIREVSVILGDQFKKEPNKKIVVGTEGYFGTLPDGLQMYLKDYPEIIVIGTGLDFKEVPQSLIDSRKAGNKTYLVVNDTRFNERWDKNDYRKLGLTLIATYQKTSRARHDTHEYIWYGDHDSLYFFEVTDQTITAANKND